MKRNAVVLSIATVALSAVAVVAVAAGCSKDSEASVQKREAPASPAAASVSGEGYAVTMTADACKAGSTCVAKIKLDANGGFHVNREFPHKFTADKVDGVEYQSAAGSNVFNKADLASPLGEKDTSATMLVKFKPSSAGTVNVSGAFKFGVCNEGKCLTDSKQLSLAVTVK